MRSRVKGLIPRNSKITIPLADVIFMQMSRRKREREGGSGRSPGSIFARFSYASSNLYSSTFVFCCIFYRVRKWVTGIKETGIKNFFPSCLARKIRCFEKFGGTIVTVNQNSLLFFDVYNINKYRCQFLL